MKKKKRAKKLKIIAGLIFLLIITGAAAWLIQFEPPQSSRARIGKTAESRRDLVKKRQHDYRPRKHDVSERQSVRPVRSHLRKLAVVIDDIGYDRTVVDALLQIKSPITISILPFCKYSVESAERAHRAGREVLLHLPMEPHGYPEHNPGRGVLLTTMAHERLRRQLSEDLRAVPHIRGVNNHMGSSFMENEPQLELVFKRLKEEKLFFLDSRTTRTSKALAAAEATGIRFVSRDIFIDNGGDAESTYRELIDIVRRKESWNKMVVIGHPYPGTIAALKRIVPKLPSEGIEVVPVSRLQ